MQTSKRVMSKRVAVVLLLGGWLSLTHGSASAGGFASAGSVTIVINDGRDVHGISHIGQRSHCGRAYHSAIRKISAGKVNIAGSFGASSVGDRSAGQRARRGARLCHSHRGPLHCHNTRRYLYGHTHHRYRHH